MTHELTQNDVGGDTNAIAESVKLAGQQSRAGYYGCLAALLRSEPDVDLLQSVTALAVVDGHGGELEVAMAMLAVAADSCSLEAVREEYFNLFIGLGRGELVPYGSWYQTGFLMEKPLGALRDDLCRLGFERDQTVREPEDHVAALFEVMAMMIQDGHALAQQAEFFDNHLSGWITRFFDDLAGAKAATFYMAVARFGAGFVDFEKQYLDGLSDRQVV